MLYLNMIDYIVDAHGFTREQAYCLTSVAVDLKVSQVVDVPNIIVLGIPAAEHLRAVASLSAASGERGG